MFQPKAFVVSRPAKVSDPKAVRDVLERYDLTFGVAELEESYGDWVLRLEGGTWPEALKRGKGWSKKYHDLEAAIHRYGAQHFKEFLLKLAPYLLTPLTIRAVQGWDGVGDLDAREWHVEPGATEVEVNGFVDRDHRMEVG
jgi:hypothetical protein